MELHVKIDFAKMHQQHKPLMMLVRHLELMEHVQQKLTEDVWLELLVMLQLFKQLVLQIHQEVNVTGMEQLVLI